MTTFDDIHDQLAQASHSQDRAAAATWSLRPDRWKDDQVPGLAQDLMATISDVPMPYITMIKPKGWFSHRFDALVNRCWAVQLIDQTPLALNFWEDQDGHTILTVDGQDVAVVLNQDRYEMIYPTPMTRPFAAAIATLWSSLEEMTVLVAEHLASSSQLDHSDREQVTYTAQQAAKWRNWAKELTE